MTAMSRLFLFAAHPSDPRLLRGILQLQSTITEGCPSEMPYHSLDLHTHTKGSFVQGVSSGRHVCSRIRRGGCRRLATLFVMVLIAIVVLGSSGACYWCDTNVTVAGLQSLRRNLLEPQAALQMLLQLQLQLQLQLLHGRVLIDDATVLCPRPCDQTNISEAIEHRKRRPLPSLAAYPHGGRNPLSVQRSNRHLFSLGLF
ncbi:hypothetical protein J3F83DRAFT_612690 [Trichoderma novae-zelandiae]